MEGLVAGWWASEFLLLQEFFKSHWKKTLRFQIFFKVTEKIHWDFKNALFVTDFWFFFFVKSHWKSRWDFKSPLFVTNFRKISSEIFFFDRKSRDMTRWNVAHFYVWTEQETSNGPFKTFWKFSNCTPIILPLEL